MSTYYAGKGTIIKMSGSTIGQVKKITPPPSKMGMAETTHLASLSKEYLATILDSGQPKFTIEWDPSQHTALYTAHKAGTLNSWSIVLGNSQSLGTAPGTVAFSAFIEEFPFAEIDPESVQMIDITLRISGDWTIS